MVEELLCEVELTGKKGARGRNPLIAITNQNEPHAARPKCPPHATVLPRIHVVCNISTTDFKNLETFLVGGRKVPM
jgi:hypothetical protein